jgi:hypothetical protein
MGDCYYSCMDNCDQNKYTVNVCNEQCHSSCSSSVDKMPSYSYGMPSNNYGIPSSIYGAPSLHEALEASKPASHIKTRLFYAKNR